MEARGEVRGGGWVMQRWECYDEVLKGVVSRGGYHKNTASPIWAYMHRKEFERPNHKSLILTPHSNVRMCLLCTPLQDAVYGNVQTS